MTPTPLAQPLVFVSYSHEDEEWMKRIVVHLSVLKLQGVLDVWDDRRIGAGQTWREEIDEALSRAQVAVLLVSASFLNSKFVLTEEVPTILERRKLGGLRVFPVIAKACAWRHVPWLDPLMVRPKDGGQLLKLKKADREQALADIAIEIAGILRPGALDQPLESRPLVNAAGAPIGPSPPPAQGDGVIQVAPHPPSTEGEFERDLARAVRQPGPREFELLDTFWSRCAEHQPVSIDRLAGKSAGLLTVAGSYPWSVRILGDAGLTDQDLRRLRRRDMVLVASAGSTVEFAVTRLLPWAVATGLLSGLRAGSIAAQDLLQQGLACMAQATAGKPWLGDAVLDLLWQLSGDDQRLQITVDFLAALEGHPSGQPVVQAASSVGRRILPAVFSRLRTHVQTDGSWSIRYIALLREMSRRESTGDIALRALTFLNDSDPTLQQAGISILSFSPTSQALDRLWHLRCEHQGEASLPLQRQLDGALGACARTNPGWVEARLLALDPVREPPAPLLFLLLQIDSGSDIWLRRGDALIEKATGRADRAIAYCIYQFRDLTRLDWLSARVQRTDDAVGPAALRALLFLEPDRELPPFGTEELDLQIFFRGWWFQLYLTDAESRANSWILGQLQHHSNPWWLAMMYGGLETWMAEPVLELLLHKAGEILAAEAANPTDGRLLHRPLRLLSSVQGADLLPCFERRRGAPFEQHLTDFLIRLGPNDSGMTRYVDDDGLAVLRKICGEGYATVATFYFQKAQTALGQREGIDLAVCGVREEGLDFLAHWVAEVAPGEPEPTTVELLTARTQSLCLLAAAGRFRAVVDGVVKWGLRIPRDLHHYLNGVRFSDFELAPAVDRLDGAQTPPGSLLAIGLGHRFDLAPRVRAVLKGQELPSDLVIAGLLALDLLADESAEAEELLLAHLASPETFYAASRRLFRLTARPAVRHALLDDLARLGEETSRTSLDPLPLDLLLLPETRADAARILWDQYSASRRLFFVGDRVQHLAVLGDEVKDFLYQVATGQFPRTGEGSRASAIAGLLQLDSHLASEAAQELLEDELARERSEAPRLLLAADVERALPLLERALANEKDLLLLAAIGEALDRMETPSVPPRLDVWLEAPSEALRLGACIAAEAAQWTSNRERLIIERMRDDDWDVRSAAAQALEPVRRSRHLALVVAQLADPNCRDSRRWPLLDAALALGHPGISYTPLWFERLTSHLPYPALRYVSEGHELARKELREELGRRERPGHEA